MKTQLAASLRSGRGRSRLACAIAVAAIIVGGGFALDAPGQPVAAAPAPIDILVWQDVDGNGTRNATFESGLADVAIVAYDAAGQVVQTTLTDANGAATIAADSTTPYRVQAIAPGSLVSAPEGPDNGTSVQFVHGGDSVEIAFQDPNNIIGPADDDVFVPIFAFGDRSFYGSDPDYPADTVAGLAFPAPTGTLTNPPANTTYKVPVGDIGAVYGSAWAPSRESVFVSSYVKRHSGLGPNATGGTTTGGIYRVEPSGPGADTATGELWADLNQLLPAAGLPGTGADPHPAPGSTCTYTATRDDGTTALALGPDAETCWLTDKATYGQVGKLGLGDLELSPTGDAMWTVNLASRQLVRVHIVDEQAPATVADVSAFDLSPLFGDCGYTYTNGSLTVTEDGTTDFRPFGLGADARTGLMYLSVTCTGEHLYDASGHNMTAVGAAGALRSLVYSFEPRDPASTLTKVLDDDLTTGADGGAIRDVDLWLAWTSDWTVDLIAPEAYTVNTAMVFVRPRPLAADVVLVNGKLIVGHRDMTADRWGSQTAAPVDAYTAPTNPWNPNDRYGGLVLDVGQGDAVTACLDPSNPAAGYALESSGNCGPYIGNNNLEFLNDNWGPVIAGFDENFMGSVGVLPNRTDDLIATSVHTGGASNSAGVTMLQSGDGAFTANSVKIYTSDPNQPGTRFGKANGLGALAELTSIEPRIELGNRVWYDANGNGVQDADEAGVSGVTVRLYDRSRGAAVLIGTTLTNSAGEYYFRSNEDFGASNGAAPIDVIWTGAAGPQGHRISPHDGTRYEIRVDNAANYMAGGPLDGWVATAADVDSGQPASDEVDSDGLPAGAPVNPAAGPYAARMAASQPGWFNNNHSNDFGFFRPGGDLDITKVVSGAVASLPGQQFDVTFSCTDGNGVAIDLASFGITLPIAVEANQTVTVSGLPAGAICTNFEEVRTDPNNPNVQWLGAATFTPTSVTTNASGTPITVELENRTEFREVEFRVRKDVNLSSNVSVSPSQGFTVNWECTNGQAGSFTIVDGQTVPVSGIDAGTSCRVSEVTPANPPGGTWNPPVVTPAGFQQLDYGSNFTFDILNSTTTNPGRFDVRKVVTGNGAGLVPSSATFRVHYTCNNGVAAGDIDVSNNGVAAPGPLMPAGTVCTLSEITPASGNGYHWGTTGTFSPSASVTVIGGTTPLVSVTVTNEALLDDGRFSVTKTVDGSGAALVVGKQFTVDWSCNNGAQAGQMILVDGQQAFSPPVPAGSLCEVTEVQPIDTASLLWSPPLVTPQSPFIVPGGPATNDVAIQLTNSVQLISGGFAVVKQVAGTGAQLVIDSGVTFDADWSCSDGQSGTIEDLVPGVASDPLDGIANGATCTVTEVQPLPGVNGVDWQAEVITGGVFVVDTNQAHLVTIANHAYKQDGSFELTKQLTGAGSVPPNTSFRVHYDCGAGQQGDLQVIPGGPAVVVDAIVADSTCTLTEEDLTAKSPGVVYGAPVFTPGSTFVVPGGGQPAVTVTLTNEAGIAPGHFVISKEVTGAAAGLVADTVAFEIAWECTDGASTLDGILAVTTVSAVSSPDIPAGFECEVEEVLPLPSIAGVDWGAPVIDNASFLIDGGTSPAVEILVTNTANLSDGSFAVRKAVTGKASGIVPAGTEFTVAYECSDGSDGTLILADGATLSVSGIAAGSDCSLDETVVPDVPGVAWADPVFMPGSTFAVAGGNTAPVELLLTNEASFGDGGFTVTKTVAGNGASVVPLNMEFVVSWSCSDGSTGELRLAPGESESAAGIAAGSDCSLTESTLPAVNGVSWETPAFTPGATIHIGGGLAPSVQVSLTNTATRTTGALEVTKRVTGPGAGLVPVDAVYTVTYSCSDGTVGSFVLVAGETRTVEGLPAEATCEVAETRLPDVESVSWAVPAISPQAMVHIVSGETTAVVVTNVADIVGNDPVPPPNTAPLPQTGSNVSQPLSVGAALAAAGLVLVAINRTRRRRA